MRLYDRVNPGSSQQARFNVRPIKTYERERPPIVRHSVHITREAEHVRLDAHPEFDASRVFNPTSLEAPPARPGFVQRWIVDATNPQATRSEQRNWFSKMRQGWQLRDPETVPEQLRYLYPSVKLSDNSVAIRVAGSVLVEMPVNISEQRRLAVNDRIEHLNKSIPESTQELAAKGRRGVGPLRVEDHVDSYRGRAPGVMAN